MTPVIFVTVESGGKREWKVFHAFSKLFQAHPEFVDWTVLVMDVLDGYSPYFSAEGTRVWDANSAYQEPDFPDQWRPRIVVDVKGGVVLDVQRKGLWSVNYVEVEVNDGDIRESE